MFGLEKIQLEIITFDKIEDGVLDYLKENLGKIFSAQVHIGENLELPQYAYDQKREQFSSSLILDRIPPQAGKKILAVIDQDLYVAGLNFVFGEADPQKGVCIISLKRLRQTYYGLKEDRDLFLKRALKEAVHEIGHLFHLRHCPNPKCVMHFSNCFSDTDIKDYDFCSRCKRYLRGRYQ